MSTKIFCWFFILGATLFIAGLTWLFAWSFLSGDIPKNKLADFLLLLFGTSSYACAIFLGISIVRSHIVTSDDGLEYHGVGVNLFSSWEDMKYIKLGREVGLSRINTEVIVLMKPPEILLIRWYGKIFLGKGYIPLSDFGKWRQNSLGNEIRRYAPRLVT
jgi:hypothetical protein